MKEMQKYVPMVETVENVYVSSLDRTVKVTKTRAHLIQFAGDQKTAARGEERKKQTCVQYHILTGLLD